MNRTQREAGFGAAGLLFLIVLAAIGAGAWNYHRNLELERASRATRPLAGYTTADLEALADAYRSEVAARSARYQGAQKQRAVARDRAYFDEQVREFEKVQRAASRSRDVGGDLAEREAALRDVEQELAARASEAGGWEKHWQRLVRF
jgi:hypothetical protein